MGEEEAEGGAELTLDAIDMVGNEAVHRTGEIHAEKSILFSRGREWSRVQIVSDFS